VNSRSLLALLAATVFTTTFSIGGFPPLLPELGASAQLSDRELGMVAAAFGFARMVVAIPVGMLIARHLRALLLVGPVILAAGIVMLSLARSLEALLLARMVMGVGHSATMIGGLTAVLRYYTGPRLGAALNAIEFLAMIGMLGGVTLIGVLPTTLGWNWALLVVCSPLLPGVALAPLMAAAVPAARPTAAVGSERVNLGPSRASRPLTALAVLAFAAGSVVAMTYATVEQFLIPVRGTREFGLDRVGIARLFSIMQVCDIVALLPAGVLADRLGGRRVLSVVLLTMAAGGVFIALGNLPMLALGCALAGLGMAGWMLPLGVLRQESAPEQIGWRAAVYRVGVDGGMFLGPFVAGLLGAERAAPALVLAVVLAAISVALLVARAGGRLSVAAVTERY
jgi:MFS family permease